MAFDLNKWYDKLNQGDVLLSYKGEITPELITNMLDTLEHKLDNREEKNKIKKKLYNVLVESLQNLYHHISAPPETAKPELNDKFAIFVITKEKDGYKISTGNFINVDRKKMLKDRLDQINFLSKQELKSLYKLILSNDIFSDKGGGGLGIIDIARKSGNKLHYEFHDYNGNYFFFCLDIII